MKQFYLPPIIVDFLKQQAISLPQYHKPVPFKSNYLWPKLQWLIWGAIAIVIFQVTIIISFGNSFNNWYVVLLSLLMMGLGGIGVCLWVKSVYYSPEFQLYQYKKRQYKAALKLLERQQHRKLKQLLSGKLPKLVKENKLTPEDKPRIGVIKKKFPFLQVYPKMKGLKDENWLEIEWVLVSQRTNVFIGVFFLDNNSSEILGKELLETHWIILPVNSLESLVNTLDYLKNKLNLI